MKTKHIRKIGLAALIMLIFTALSLLIGQLGQPIKTRAEYSEDAHYAVSQSTFANMYSNVKESVKNSMIDDELQAKFETLEFQNNTDNFDIIRANDIAKIKDLRYGVTLGEESKAIQLNREKAANGDFGKIVGPKISEQSTLTVFTYGQGGTLAHWSNSGAMNPLEIGETCSGGNSAYIFLSLSSK